MTELAKKAQTRYAEMDFPPFSVSMCVYGKDNPDWFDESLDSVMNQSVRPSEVVLVVDGPIPDTIQKIIDKYLDLYKADNGTSLLKPIYLKENQGHGNARRCGLENCSNEIVALMDADDICTPDRFEQELKAFQQHDVAIVGGNISEFIGNPGNIIACRNVPESHDEIQAYMKKRCPFNQQTVMFKKSVVQNAGGYLDWYCDEDYYLWIRMAETGCRMLNTGTTLVYFRVSEDMYQRRGGYKYFKSEAKLQKYMLDHKLIGFGTYTVNCLKRLIVQVLFPNKVRGWVFQKFARSKE